MGLSLRFYTGDDEDDGSDTVWSRSITHNLTPMARAAGVYMAMWRPEEIGIERARDLIPPLAAGLVAIAADPEKFEAMNPENGWGSFEGLCSFIGEAMGAAALKLR